HHLTRKNWSNVEIFMDEFSIRAGEDWKNKCIEQAKIADLGIIVLSEYTQRSEYVSQEIGILLGKGIPVIYVALHENWKIPPGYEKTIKSFPLYEAKNPMVGFEDLAELIGDTLNINRVPHTDKLKQAFEIEHLGEREGISLSYRDAYTINHAIKCADSEVKIIGENALYPIHGGFEYLLQLLKKEGVVQVLLLNYNARIYRNREEIEKSVHAGRIRADWIASMGNLIELERMRERQGTLTVRLHSTQPRGSLIIVDRWLFQFNPYEPAGMGGRRGFGHEVHIWLNRGVGKNKFSDYSEMFSRLWNDEANIELNLKNMNIKDILLEEIQL
ncbi:MAG: hypothetical protein SVY15_09665, partial [Halobacteriota archaeon]|nr:hypothetical protein [Halobacteriota archaeon]